MAENNTQPTLRLENKTRLIVLNYLGEKFEIISGPLSGTVKKETRAYENTTGRTAEQLALINLAKIANAKVAAGYKVVKGSVDEINEQVAKYTTVAKDLVKAQKALERTNKALEKLAPKWEAAVAKRQAAEELVANLQAKVK